MGWDAKIMYEFTGGEVIKGVEIKDIRNGAKSRTVCRIHKKMKHVYCFIKIIMEMLIWNIMISLKKMMHWQPLMLQ